MSTRRRQDQGGSNVGAKRNKKGTPVYSHEDIREQYCINNKELVALEASRRKPIFGCLTSRNVQPSPCHRKSLIGACFRTQGPSDENIYGKTPSLSTSPSHRKQPIDYEDENYFKRRPKTICYTDPKKLASLDDSLAARLNSRPRSDTEPSQYDNTKSSSSSAAIVAAVPSSDAAKRPTKLTLASEEFHSEEILKDSSDKSREVITVHRSAFTQPNTPDLPHTARFRNGGNSVVDLEERVQQKHVSFQQKSVSRSVGLLEDKACSPIDINKSIGSKSQERLLDAPKSPEYYEQKVLDSLFAPVLTKALLQEKLKRTCMRTQATQTDTDHVRKSMPQLSLSPFNEKTEMVSQAAQTNGEGRRRLVKSLSEATADYDGFDYEIYDTDELPPPPPPPQHPVPLYMPMCPSEYSAVWPYPSYHHRTMHNGKSCESIRSEVINRCRCYSRSESEDEILICSPSTGRRILTKTMSEGEILQNKRKALGYASGYMEIDLNCDISREEDIIEPMCVDEGSYDLSNSRIFSQEDTDEDEFHEHYLCPTLSRQSSGDGRYSYPSDNELMIFDPLEIDLDERLRNRLDRISPDEIRRPNTIMPQLITDHTSTDEVSPVEISLLTDSTSFLESGDHLEESISDSQVTVLQKLPMPSGTNIHQASDSDNGIISTKHKSITQGGSFDEELEDEASKKSSSLLSASQLSSISDEQTSISENVISDSSQVIVSLSTTSSEMEKAIALSLDNDCSSIDSAEALRKKYDGKSYIEPHDDGLLNKLVQEMMSETQLRLNEVRKLTSPESDSSSSHFTEQETSRSLASGNTNTVTSRSDLSRTDSHPNTDHSETSEDYVTATDNSSIYENSEQRRSIDEKHVSSPPRMDDIIEDESLPLKILDPEVFMKALPGSGDISHSSSFGPTNDFDTAQDLISLDTTTSASHHVEEEYNIFASRDEFSVSPSVQKSLNKSKIKTEEYNIPDVDVDRANILSIILESKLSSIALNENAEFLEDNKTGAIKKRYPSDQNLKHETSVGNSNRRQSLPEEERDKLKSVLKLNFPPGVTMFSQSMCWDEELEIVENNRTNKPIMVDASTSAASINLSKKSDSNDGERNKHDKARRKSAEVTTPGMVRSPAMHEGFRLEDWSIVRTPGTPDTLVEIHSSDESFNESKVFPRNVRSEKKKDKKKIKEEKLQNICIKPAAGFTQHDVPIQYHEDRIVDTSGNKISSTMSSFKTPVRDRFDPNDTFIDISIPQPHSMINSDLNNRRGSGDSTMMTWTRNSQEMFRNTEQILVPRENLKKADSFLGPGDILKKAESLRSFSPGSDNVFLVGSNEQIHDSGMHICTHCGERPLSHEEYHRNEMTQSLVFDRRSYEKELRARTLSHRARSEERNSFTKDWGMTAISLELGDAPRNGGDDDERGLYTEAYLASPWLYVGPNDELLAWRKDALPPPFIPPHARIPGFSYPEMTQADDPNDDGSRSGRESPESTSSERDFRTRYQAITHRMVHRKSSVEMYRRLINGTFELDKTVNVLRDAGEFGFRIHGSRPVVVSAIEAQTPAELSGLEVGDIVLSINDIDVLDASHSDVVRLAHCGSDTLRLAVARTCDVLTPLVTNDPTPICAGYLYKLGGAHHPPGTNAISRKWHRRWFALKKDNCLYYYKSEVDQTPLGAVHLLNYSVHALVDGGRQFTFTVAKFGGTTLHLAAKTEDSRNRWGQVLTQVALQAAQRDELIEESARRVQQSPGAIATPDCFGYLHKLGSRWHQWKRRYCVIKDACLYLYHDTDATNAIGVVHLHGYRVQSTSIGGKKHAFELIPPEPKFRHFYFCTDSENDKKRWLAGLEYSIDRWIKVG